MRSAGLVLALLAAAFPLAAQERPRVEKGSPSELKGVHRLFVAAEDPDCRADLSARITDEVPEIEIVSEKSSAEALLVVSVWTELRRPAPPSEGCLPCEAQRRAAEPTESITHAVASVVREIGPNAYRQLSKSTWAGAVPSTVRHQIVQHFAAAYRKANPRPPAAPAKEVP